MHSAPMLPGPARSGDAVLRFWVRTTVATVRCSASTDYLPARHTVTCRFTDFYLPVRYTDYLEVRDTTCSTRAFPATCYPHLPLTVLFDYCLPPPLGGGGGGGGGGLPPFLPLPPMPRACQPHRDYRAFWVQHYHLEPYLE